MKFRTIFLFLALVELTSLAGYFFPILNAVGFFVIVAAALVLSMQRLEYGLYFALADLILGGRNGALFSFQAGGFFLSLRMALFIVVMAVWGAKVVSARLHNAPQPPLNLRGGVLKWWTVLGLAVAWGMVVGLVRGNGFGNVFLDANGYFYAALVLPVMWCMRRIDHESETNAARMASGVRGVFFAATTLLALKTLFAVYLFTHAGNNFIASNLVAFYRWVRDTAVGEITWLDGNFARVFFQSHVYNVVAFFVVLASLITPPTSPYLKGRKLILWTLLVLNASVIIVSLSRSFWIGTIAGLGVIGVAVVVMGPIGRIERISRIIKILGVTLLAAIALIFFVSRFPFPHPSPADLGDAARSRLEAGDAGKSRFNLLPPLMRAIVMHPIIGSGFGKTVTYISNDPRIREVNRTGQYTTYAFEWGWLDLWLKMGVLGLIGLIGLISQIGLTLYRKARSNSTSLAGFALLAALASINVFTPYLNHPLGLGILMLLTIVAEYDSMI